MSDIPPAPPTTQDILAVVNAATVDEQLRLITEQPALLLTDTVDAVLEPLLEHYANDPHTTRILAQAQSLLRRCREVGLAVVRTEMTGPQQSNALAIPPQFRLLFEQAQAPYSAITTRPTIWTRSMRLWDGSVGCHPVQSYLCPRAGHLSPGGVARCQHHAQPPL